MKTTRLRIEGQDFYLAPEQDVTALKDLATDVLRAGAGVIDFTGIDGRVISVLLSPGVAMVFETIERPDVTASDHDDSGSEYRDSDDFGH